ncbi:MAG: hypothetical protein ACYCZM_10865, partial [Acidimicrobiales bacterium]
MSTEPGDMDVYAETSEGSQEMALRSETTATETSLEQGAYLRLPEGVELNPSDIDVEVSDDETMIINMGPQ